jgi:hypothetical protein
MGIEGRGAARSRAPRRPRLPHASRSGMTGPSTPACRRACEPPRGAARGPAPEHRLHPERRDHRRLEHRLALEERLPVRRAHPEALVGPREHRDRSVQRGRREEVPELARWRAWAPTFDCRVFQVPTTQDLLDVFIWREDDAVKNSVTMLAQAHFSHSELHGRARGQAPDAGVEGRRLGQRAGALQARHLPEARVTEMRALTDTELARIPEPHREPWQALRAQHHQGPNDADRPLRRLPYGHSRSTRSASWRRAR